MTQDMTNVASIHNYGFQVGFNGTTRHFDALILATPIERARGLVLSKEEIRRGVCNYSHCTDLEFVFLQTRLNF